VIIEEQTVFVSSSSSGAISSIKNKLSVVTLVVDFKKKPSIAALTTMPDTKKANNRIPLAFILLIFFVASSL